MVFSRTVYLRALNFAYFFLDSLPLTSTSEKFPYLLYTSTGYLYANASAVTRVQIYSAWYTQYSALR
jgi:hypothetical protein